MRTARREDIGRWIKQARQQLEDHPDEPALALMEILDIPELEDADLARLAHLLWTEKYGCHKNDVVGVLDLFEEWLSEQEVKDERDHLSDDA